MKSIWKKWWFWVILLVALFFVPLFILGTIGNSLPKDTVQPTPTISQVAVKKEPTPTTATKPTFTPTPTPKAKYVFDIPSLVGKNLDQVKAILGTPKDQEATQQQIQLGAKDWSLTFDKAGQELLVTYYTGNRTIEDFFISTDDPSGKTQDKKHLLELGNLSENNSHYKVEFVKTIPDPTSFTGVKVTPL